MVTVLGANSVTGGYQVDNSLRFERASNDALNITPSNASNRKTFTVSAWIKKVDLTSDTTTAIISARVDGSNNFDLSFEDDFELRCKIEISDDNYFLRSTALYRDTSAWYHVVLAVDTTQATDTNRVKLYVNGVILSSFATSTFPDRNADTSFNNTNVHQIGGTGGGGQTSMYLSEMVVIDGQALDPTSFGEFDEDSGIWKPIKVSGLTFGTNGFYLEFKQAGTGTNASGMGADTSGNTNHLAVANLTAIDQSTDTCTNNFATWNSLFRRGTITSTFTDGNLTSNFAGGAQQFSLTTFGVTTGKWYAEIKWISAHGNGATATGILDMAYTGTADPNNAVTNAFGYFGSGTKNVSGSASSYGASYGAGDIISLLINCDDNELIFQKNGASQASGAAIDIVAGVTYGIFGSDYDGKVASLNTGSPPYAISSGNADGNGYGNFEYAVPSGYFALNTKNLAEYG